MPTIRKELAQEEKTIVGLFKKEGLHAKPLSGSDYSYNCHSYTFTDGKAGHIIEKADVEQIIQDNGFRSITRGDENGNYTSTQPPQKEDIIIYRDKQNDPIHSGVISRVDNDPKKMIVRAKMGNYGIFEHSGQVPKKKNFEVTHWEIYHTDRPQGRLITEVPCSDEE